MLPELALRGSPMKVGTIDHLATQLEAMPVDAEDPFPVLEDVRADTAGVLVAHEVDFDANGRLRHGRSRERQAAKLEARIYR